MIHWFIPSGWHDRISLGSHFTLVIVLFVAIMRNRHLGLLFGLWFGLMHDIVYSSPMIGPHSLSMAIVGYLAGIIARRLKLTIAKSLFIISFSIVLYDAAVYALYRLFRVVVMPFGDMFIDYMMPALFFNLLFAILIYVPARKWLEKNSDRREEA